MAAAVIELDKMTVDDVLRRWPDTAVIFRQYGLACLGCAVAPFCEVTAVANIYNLPKEQFLADLHAAINKSD
jgi:hybrid cluster-associated redox disulfide protein